MDKPLITTDLLASCRGELLGVDLAVAASGAIFMAACTTRKRIVMVLATMIATIGMSGIAAAQEGFRIVVNPSNPVSSLSKTQVSKLFLEKGAWDDGAAVAPVDLLPTSPIREGFSKEVLGLPVPAAIDRIRETAKASGSNPSPAMASDREVLAYVRLKPGAIGYVSLAADVSGVKVVAVGGKTDHLLAGTAAATPSAAPIAVGGLIPVPQRLVQVQPIYPAIAKAGHVQGVVELSIVIDASGNVERAQVVRSIPQLDGAAVQAVKKWKYSPTVVNGAAVPVTMIVQVTFTL
jgi:TonB family protein